MCIVFDVDRCSKSECQLDENEVGRPRLLRQRVSGGGGSRLTVYT